MKRSDPSVGSGLFETETTDHRLSVSVRSGFFCVGTTTIAVMTKSGDRLGL
jgi:hypothetical protein